MKYEKLREYIFRQEQALNSMKSVLQQQLSDLKAEETWIEAAISYQAEIVSYFFIYIYLTIAYYFSII